MSKPRGKRAGAFLEMTWFPGRVLESGPAWRARAVWEGRRGRGQGWLLWLWLAWAPLEIFLSSESQWLLGAGLAHLGCGRWMSFVEEAGGARGERQPFWSSRVVLPWGCCGKLVLGCWLRLQAGPGPEQTWFISGSAQDHADGLLGQPAHLTAEDTSSRPSWRPFQLTLGEGFRVSGWVGFWRK